MPNLLPTEIIIIAVVLLALFGVTVALVRFGAKELSDASRSLGRSMRISGVEAKGLRDDDDKEPVENESMRASNADRDRTIERLQEETALGRLTFNEFEERMERAQSAKTLGDLSQLTRDLPSEDQSV